MREVYFAPTSAVGRFSVEEVRRARRKAREYGVTGSLLTIGDDNPKFGKTDSETAHIIGLSLAQAKTSGFQVCEHATAGCMRHCVGKQGLARVFQSIPKARKRKTRFFFKDQESFLILLWYEIAREYGKAYELGIPVFCRLNVFSDLDWPKIAPWLFTDFPDIRFYDYTKDKFRYVRFQHGRFPENYHLTRSYTENMAKRTIDRILGNGGTIAVAFRNGNKREIPETWKGWPVYDGDLDDRRFLDPGAHIIGLRAKGDSVNDTTGFVVDWGVE